MSCDNNAMARFVELRSTSSSENLQDVEDTQIDECSVLRIINFSPLEFKIHRSCNKNHNFQLTRIITACAGKLTPQASVDVQTSTLINPSSKYFSIAVRSALTMPA